MIRYQVHYTYVGDHENTAIGETIYARAPFDDTLDDLERCDDCARTTWPRCWSCSTRAAKRRTGSERATSQSGGSRSMKGNYSEAQIQRKVRLGVRSVDARRLGLLLW